ncbi:alpha/beta hydrolase [Nocardia wallacei]|uniref:alpha/beta hydrolase n=1 Tax=Nocardia wallacei TaxID=480035 RepID=UPI002458D225|nr:alpha/beta hydrolase [Nocardia wallacei]
MDRGRGLAHRDRHQQWWQNQIDTLKTQAAGYDAVAGQLGARDGVPRLLSTLDTEGHAAIALRNPDTAQDVVTYVPGTGAKISEIDAGTSRAEAMRRSAELADPSKATSVVTWYGYDAPQSVTGEAPKAVYADNAAEPLDSFQDGLRVTHEGPRATDTVVGHRHRGCGRRSRHGR